MERRIAITTVFIVLILLPEIEAVCVGPQCHALGEPHVSINRRTRSDPPVFCPNNCDCFSAEVHCPGRSLLEIPTQGSALQNASILLLNYNKITEVRSGVFSNMKHLQEIFLLRNRIRTIERGAFTGLNKLSILFLKGNQLKRIAKNTFEGADIPELVTLNLRGNELESIESETFCHLKKLQNIDLSFNSITHIADGAFKGLTLLTELNLQHNSLTSAAWVIGNADSFQHLAVLDISNNDLHTLPKNIKDSLPRVHSLNLKHNSLICDRNFLLIYESLPIILSDWKKWYCKIPETMSVVDLRTDMFDPPTTQKLEMKISTSAEQNRTLVTTMPLVATITQKKAPKEDVDFPISSSPETKTTIENADSLISSSHETQTTAENADSVSTGIYRTTTFAPDQYPTKPVHSMLITKFASQFDDQQSKARTKYGESGPTSHKPPPGSRYPQTTSVMIGVCMGAAGLVIFVVLLVAVFRWRRVWRHNQDKDSLIQISYKNLDSEG
ncbi:variable lymphocyte receptor [Plakobranchus ocellatus]|uniref:Variable lymphocyte receptor n=1 Tax=Plakobranchus ocellatus TaxID=259542 RepID=A0AAV3ZB79_9GAST|nr:variable lymphocyte receptor [Plakobranchus ocellatus]